jgi:peptide/nickel transport system substrate-binding protein
MDPALTRPRSLLSAIVGIAVLASTIACTSPTPSDSIPAGVATRQAGASGPKRIVAAIRGVPPSLAAHETNRISGNYPGLDALMELVHASLVHPDDRGTLHPQLAEAVPTLENGLWQLHADGRMTTTLTIKAAARWHDGTPVTTDDLLFAAQVEQDRDLGIPRARVWDFVDAIDAQDARTVVVQWSRPYIEADAMFSYLYGLPLPKHLLQTAYAENRANFLALPYWADEFVGAGPYRMQDWIADSHVVVRKSDDYLLGIPRVDEIELRFVQDPNTVLANLLARAADMTLGRSLIPLEQAEMVAGQRGDMRVATASRSWYPLHAQFVDTSPLIVLDARFRRALLHAIDRQSMADTFIGPKTTVAHSYVGPDTPGYEAIEPAIVKYAYDPRRAVQMIEALGYSRGADGSFVDSAGQRLQVEIRTTIRAELQPKIVSAVVAYWKESGVDADQVNIPPQRMNDREFRATFPAFEMPGGNNDLTPEEIMRHHSSATPLPENRFMVTGNYSRHRSAELDSYIEKFITTIPRTERLQALARIAHYESDILPSMGLFYQVDTALIADRIQEVTANGRRATQAWNVEQWDLTR